MDEQASSGEGVDASETTKGANTLRLQLEGFEGPLDLLLHLIRRHELDIREIPIAFITDEYLQYLEAMDELDLGIAGEYLVMAATLLHIKSRELLPREDEEDADIDEDFDIREDLIRRLLAYQKYRDAAKRLNELPILGEDVFSHPSRADRYRDEVGPAELVPVGLFELLEVYRELMKTREEPAVHEVTRESLSLKEVIGQVAGVLQREPRKSLLDLVYAAEETPSVHRIVVTFMAVLEMARLKLVKLFQARLTSNDLIVERAVVDISEVSETLQLPEDFRDAEDVDAQETDDER